MAKLKPGACFMGDHQIWRVDGEDDPICAVEFAIVGASTWGWRLRGTGWGDPDNYGNGEIHGQFGGVEVSQDELVEYGRHVTKAFDQLRDDNKRQQERCVAAMADIVKKRGHVLSLLGLDDVADTKSDGE